MSLENIPHCDVFYPTETEFVDFEKYLEKCEKKATSGIIKIVPPKNWVAREEGYDSINFSIPSPIEQVVTGAAGLYEVILIQRESRLLSKYKKLVEGFNKLTEGKKPIDVEKMFWKNLKLSAPLYGADAPGTLFDKKVPWNLAEIDTILKRGLKQNGILGVTSPYLYIGAWKTLFAWHKEDLDLYSINYLHHGKPKYWYSIPLSDSVKFEELMKKTFPDSAQECSEFLRHKTFLVNPTVLLNSGIKLHKCVQNEGEFIVTFAGAYHAGFNSGYNIAEAVNFALKNWIEIGKKAKSCKCRGDTVKINMEEFEKNVKNIKEASNSTQITTSPSKAMRCVICGAKRQIKNITLKGKKKFQCKLLGKEYNCKPTNSKKPKNKFQTLRRVNVVKLNQSKVSRRSSSNRSKRSRSSARARQVIIKIEK